MRAIASYEFERISDEKVKRAAREFCEVIKKESLTQADAQEALAMCKTMLEYAKVTWNDFPTM